MATLILVQVLIKAGVNVNAKDDLNEITLIYAARCGCVDIVKVLIEAGANLSVKNNQYLNETTLLCATG